MTKIGSSDTCALLFLPCEGGDVVAQSAIDVVLSMTAKESVAKQMPSFEEPSCKYLLNAYYVPGTGHVVLNPGTDKALLS